MIQFKNQPALKTTFVGFGQGGCRMVDVFASFKESNGQPYYSTFGLNSTRNDFMELKNIPKTHLVSLDTNGFGKDPSEAIQILGMDTKSIEKISKFADEIHDENQDLTVFCTTLGGGTGTSTIIKTIEDYIQKHITPQIEKALKLMLNTSNVTMEQFNQLSPEQQWTAREKAFNAAYTHGKIKKIGIIAALPVRSDGPKTLAQVNKFADHLWKMAKNPLKGIAFITFPDNQKFYDDWLKNRDKLDQENYRDYANVQITKVFHELNLGTNMGGTDVTFDPKDFKKVMLEGNGCLNINRIAADANKITSSKDMVELLKKAFDGSLLHEPIRLQTKDEDTSEIAHQVVFNVGLLTITNKDSEDIGSAFLDEVKEIVANDIFVNGSIFTGNVKLPRTNYQTIAYSFYKTHGLPERLSTGLVKELEQYRQQKNTRKYTSDSIQKAENVTLERDISVFEETSIEGSLGSELDFLKVITDNNKDGKEKDDSTGNLGSGNSLDWLKDW